MLGVAIYFCFLLSCPVYLTQIESISDRDPDSYSRPCAQMCEGFTSLMDFDSHEKDKLTILIED